MNCWGLNRSITKAPDIIIVIEQDHWCRQQYVSFPDPFVTTLVQLVHNAKPSVLAFSHFSSDSGISVSVCVCGKREGALHAGNAQEKEQNLPCLRRALASAARDDLPRHLTTLSAAWRKGHPSHPSWACKHCCSKPQWKSCWWDIWRTVCAVVEVFGPH